MHSDSRILTQPIVHNQSKSTTDIDLFIYIGIIATAMTITITGFSPYIFNLRCQLLYFPLFSLNSAFVIQFQINTMIPGIIFSIYLKMVLSDI